MLNIRPSVILNAIEGGDIESQVEGNKTQILLNRKVMQRVPVDTKPTVRGDQGTGIVEIVSGSTVVARVQTEETIDVATIADTFAFLLQVDWQSSLDMDRVHSQD